MALTRQIVDLPTYPFQRQRYWFQAKSEAAPRDSAASRPTGHPLLGSRLRCAASEAIYEAHISSDVPGFIQHHRVLDRVVLPATAYLDMLVATAHEVLRADIVCVEDVIIREAMLFEDGKAARVVQTVCGPACDGVVPASINSAAEGAGHRCLGAPCNGKPSRWRSSHRPPIPRCSNCVSDAPRQWRQKNFMLGLRGAALISEGIST